MYKSRDHDRDHHANTCEPVTRPSPQHMRSVTRPRPRPSRNTHAFSHATATITQHTCVQSRDHDHDTNTCVSHATATMTMTTTHAICHATMTATIMTPSPQHIAYHLQYNINYSEITPPLAFTSIITLLQTSTLREIGHNNHNHPIIIIE